MQQGSTFSRPYALCEQKKSKKRRKGERDKTEKWKIKISKERKIIAMMGRKVKWEAKEDDFVVNN